MNKAEDIYLRLLRRSVFGESGLNSNTTKEMTISSKELQEILQLCRIHGTGPLVYNELLKQAELPEPAMAMQMKQACMQNMLLQGKWEEVIAKCFGALESENGRAKDGEGVYAVLMKGFAYARLYPLPYLRAWGDLDVWVGPEQYHKACGILREAFPDAKHHDEEWEELKHYCFVFENGMAIELHRVSMDFLSPREQTYWNALTPIHSQDTHHEPNLVDGGADGKENEYIIEVGGVRVPVFELKFDLLFCFMHSWEHFCGSGMPLKQVCDMALLVRNARCVMQDWSSVETYLEKYLRALKMLEVWRYYGYMACKVMGMDMAEWPLLVETQRDGEKCAVDDEVVKYGERLYEQVMKEGQSRRKDYGEAGDRYEAREQAKKMNVFARKLKTLSGRMEKARFLRQFAPRYARHVLWQEIRKGIRRTIQRKGMIDY